jgi:hypothetical protein
MFALGSFLRLDFPFDARQARTMGIARGNRPL